MGEDRTDRGNAEGGSYQRRVTASEAAEQLGISEGAVRMRVKRGTLQSTREGRRLFILLNTDPTTEQERPHNRTHDRTSELIATLREQLQAERQAHAEARRIIMQQAVTMRQLTAASSQEAPEDAETVEEAPERAEPRPATGEAQEGTRRPWWRRIIGG